MKKKNYYRMLYDAKQDLARDLVERQKLDERIARKQAVVGDLQNLCAELDHKQFEKRVDGVIRKNLKVGITEAARVILREKFFSMTASELRKAMEDRKYNLTPYKNPLAVIHTILKRLVQSGDVRVVLQPGSKKTYQWISATDKALSQLQNSSRPIGQMDRKSKESK